jgi:hypothetical protein
MRILFLGLGAAVLVGVGYIGLSFALRGEPAPRSLQSALRALGPIRTTPSDSGLRYHYPMQGVYELKGSGTEHISFPPLSEKDSKVMPGSVRVVAGGCWIWRVDYNVAHWESYEFCPTGGQLVLQGDQNWQTWSVASFSITNLARFTCPAGTTWLPGQSAAGGVTRQTCSGTSTAVAVPSVASSTTTIKGIVTLVIGGEPIRAVDEVQVTTLSGGQKGTVTEQWWLDLSTGLPLRVQRHIALSTSSVIGTINYAETGQWQMASFDPLTR